MHNLTDHLKEFNDILIPWHRHFVIGGIWSLRLHGLIVRDTADLDMIVYNPSEDLLDTLMAAVKDETDEYPLDTPNARRRSFKIMRNGMTMDFLVEYTEPMSDDLLVFQYSDRLWPVQDIQKVIEAKKRYNREKDLNDFINFKQDNF